MIPSRVPISHSPSYTNCTGGPGRYRRPWQCAVFRSGFKKATVGLALKAQLFKIEQIVK
jgi:hypothetical protein